MQHGLAPDPARGVFSTLLVSNGRPVELEAHLSLLGESVCALYAAELPARAAELIADRARALELGRVRLACGLGEDRELWLDASAGPIDRGVVLAGAALDLRTAPVHGWHGAHKWVDRRLLDRLDAAAAPAAALLVERDGRVLETTRANVFALGADGVLRTPPCDGAVLPGTTRAQAIAIARDVGVTVSEEPLRADALRVAREVFVTGSIRGVEPVRSLDGVALRVGDGLAREVADVLRHRWFERAGPRVGAGRA